MTKLIKSHPVTVATIANNTVKIFQHRNFKEAAMYTAMSLVDNGHATKREAQEWQATIKDAGIYTFGDRLFEFVQTATAEDDLTLPTIHRIATMREDDSK